MAEPALQSLSTQCQACTERVSIATEIVFFFQENSLVSQFVSNNKSVDILFIKYNNSKEKTEIEYVRRIEFFHDMSKHPHFRLVQLETMTLTAELACKVVNSILHPVARVQAVNLIASTAQRPSAQLVAKIVFYQNHTAWKDDTVEPPLENQRIALSLVIHLGSTERSAFQPHLAMVKFSCVTIACVPDSKTLGIVMIPP